ncbi:MAG: sensor histidine kinase, partial [Sulfurimonas sp.]|nr:sensor histidine kinase [Sulfurimonas sp.]
MFSKSSIRQSFLIQLIFASASLIFIFSSILYFYIERSIFEEKHQELLNHAKNIAHNESLYDTDILTPDIYLGLNVEIIQLKKMHSDGDLYETTRGKKTYLTIIHPFNIDELSYLKITKEITATRKLLDGILRSLFIINIAGFLLVIIYAIG